MLVSQSFVVHYRQHHIVSATSIRVSDSLATGNRAVAKIPFETYDVAVRVAGGIGIERDLERPGASGRIRIGSEQRRRSGVANHIIQSQGGCGAMNVTNLQADRVSTTARKRVACREGVCDRHLVDLPVVSQDVTLRVNAAAG